MINMDFMQRVVLDTNNMDWQPSPIDGIWRKPLARESKEKGHATSLVRYEKGTKFSSHNHPGGEEIFVLEGTFSDETGDYPPGTYIRNPEGFSHAPFSKDGCTIFVKLHQFNEGDKEFIRLNTKNEKWLQGSGGLKVMPLHSYQNENVALVKWPKNEVFTPHQHFGGEEVFVLSGQFIDEHGRYPELTWIRSPHLSQHQPYVEEETILWVKTGHLL